MNISPGEHLFNNNGLKLRYNVAGRGPVLMVQPSGWGIGAGLYEYTFGLLENHFTLIYHDPRGSGRSETPADPQEMNVGAFVEDLESLREHLELDSFALIGHSHGGLIALNYALKYPRRLSHLVPLDAQLGVDEPREDAQRNLPELGKDARFTDAVQAFGSPWKLESDEDMRTLVERVWPLYFFDPESEAAAATRKFVRASRISVAAMKATSASDGRFLVRDKLSAIRVPTLVLVGRHDFLCSPVQAKIIHEGVKASRLVVFEKSGHLPWLEEPRMFFPTVTGFLADRS
jgi:proline-specific peptidase